MRSLLICCVLGFFSFIIPAQATAENIFVDTPRSHPFYESIQFAKENNIVQGYDDGTFRPDQEINRAEFLKIALLAIYSQEEIINFPIQDTMFKDNRPENRYYKYISFAFKHEIIKGYPDGTFRPLKSILLPEALKIIFRTQNIDMTKFKTQNWHDEFISKAQELGIFLPRGKIVNNLQHKVTRGEMVWIIHKIQETQQNTTDMKNWWQPKPETSWQWQLSGKINTNYDVEVYDVDLIETPQSTINLLHSQGKKVICYFNGGAYEPYRLDADKFPKEVLGENMEGWEDEKWLNISNYKKFADIMTDRLDLAVIKKCDGVEPDNMDGYVNKTGFPLTYEDQFKYNKRIANEAHQRNLAIGLKNDLNQIKDLINYFDFAVNEQCFEYDECNYLLPFIDTGKAVFTAEYELEPKDFCKQARKMKFSSLKMDYNLDGRRISCNDEA